MKDPLKSTIYFELARDVLDAMHFDGDLWHRAYACTRKNIRPSKTLNRIYAKVRELDARTYRQIILDRNRSERSESIRRYHAANARLLAQIVVAIVPCPMSSPKARRLQACEKAYGPIILSCPTSSPGPTPRES